MISHFKTKFFTFLDWVTKQGETTWRAVTLHSIVFVLYAMRPFFNHLMYFVLQENWSILLKIKRQSFQAFWGYFICSLFLLLLHQYHSAFCTLPSNTALFHSFHSPANVLGTKHHFRFYIN